MNTDNTIETLQMYGDKIREQAVQNLIDNGSYNDGVLAKSITNEVFENELIANIAVNKWYGVTVEEGIGRGPSPGKIPPIAPIKNWITKRNLVPKPGVTVDQFAYAIATNISKKGSKKGPYNYKKPFLAPAVKLIKDQYGDSALQQAVGKDINDTIQVAYRS